MASDLKYQKIKNLLFGLVLLLLLLSWIEQNLHFIQLKPLGGEQPTIEKSPFTANNWRSGVFQEGQEVHVNQRFGLRPFMVRLYNEIFDRLFDEYQAKGVIMGKDGFLFEENYLLAASGRDFLGADSILLLADKLALIQQNLASQQKQLLVCLAPGKGSYFIDKMPSAYSRKNKERNHPEFVKALSQRKIPLFDIQTWFLNLKAKTPYPLFPKTGIHWSSYGEYLVADSLIKRVAELAQKPLPHLQLLSIEQDSNPRDRDDDIELGMNLLRDLPDFKMAYPKFRIVPLNADQKAPKVLVIGDSFYYGMYNWGMMEHVFVNGEFWYYNHERLIPKMPSSNVSELTNYASKVQDFDVILLLITEANLPRFGFGMIESYLNKK